MKIPTSLKHKPVIVVNNYEHVDGKVANESDAKGLSIGLAQWNDRGSVEASAKVWRHTGEKWSRQSEELPLHRVLDLALLICRTSLYFQDAYRFPKYYDPADPQIDRIGMQGDAMTVEVCTTNEKIDTDIRLLADVLGGEGERLGERFRLLSDMLKRMGY
ncbi:MAG: DUF6530 family protein [Sphaerochaeta sp.]|uniref:DUF6530 family protein n=1 Tax=Sphaerochaeta sp. TaxID=1972642 RepID=UPI001E0EF49E|nr:DUF6530 family protein [Sphaerochaeta sp.]MDD3928260.1 DUF6530 family protein [Sphaerochaeta sp.]NCC89107.1 hypothetical protein [Spirochaetia bacterium]